MSVVDPYYDPVDLTICVDAGDSAGAVNARCLADGAFFPLWLNSDQPLGELFLKQRACSRSFRYGVLADNVLGSRWRLPVGKAVQLGGRVVKNVAGFELLRLFAASQGRFGRPETLVLRLRPLAADERIWRLNGPWEALQGLALRLRRSAWAHVIDALDLDATLAGPSLSLLFAAPAALQVRFSEQLYAMASAAGAAMEGAPSLPQHSQHPAARLQSTQGGALALAQELRDAFGGRASGFLGQGLLHFDPDPEAGAAFLRALPGLHARCAALGGHVEHPALSADAASPQQRWERQFLAGLGSLP